MVQSSEFSRCPPGSHLGSWAVLVFERNLHLVKPNPQQISGKSANSFLRYSPEYKFQDGRLAAIILVLVLVSERNLPVVYLNPHKIQVNRSKSCS
jgi:hypothetical protein